MELRRGVVSVLTAKNVVVGTGFVVSGDGLIATCSHVIQSEALQKRGEPKPDKVIVVFGEEGLERTAKVSNEWWRGYDAGNTAVLQVDGSLPPGIEVLRLGSSSGVVSHLVRTFGFPNLRVNGLAGHGEVLDLIKGQGDPLLVLRSNEITPLFSGAPVWDDSRGCVIGMVTRVTKPDGLGPAKRITYITPSETLTKTCRRLDLAEVCPFRGLENFTEFDGEFFRGRERVMEQLLTSLRQELRFLAVLGPSGAGKSSLVQAGLIRKLRQGAIFDSHRWATFLVRPADQPFERLARCGLHGASEGLVGVVQRWLSTHPEQTRIVLVVDQFEELLMTCPENVRDGFLRQLCSLLTESLPVTLVITMRDEFYSTFIQRSPILAEWLPRGLVNLLPALEKKVLTAMIEEPSRAVGIDLEDGLVEAILSDVTNYETSLVAARRARSTILPLLELTLTELWNKRRDGAMRHEAYAAIGGIAKCLTQWADRAFYGLEESRRPIARYILTSLVNFGDPGHSIPDSRRCRSIGDLMGNEKDPGKVWAVLQELADARLVVIDQAVVQIVHDTLICEWELMQEWLQREHLFLLWHQRFETLVDAWTSSGPDPTLRDEDRLLKNRQDLVEAEGWLTDRHDQLEEAERDFLNASRRWCTREDERWKNLYEQAEQQRRVAISRQLAARASGFVEDRIDLALLLFLEAAHTEDTFEARSGLFNTLQSVPFLKSVLYARRHYGQTLPYSPSVAVSRDGSWLVVGHADGILEAWNLQTTAKCCISISLHDHPVSALAFGRDEVFAAADDDGTILFCDLSREPPEIKRVEDRDLAAAITWLTFNRQKNVFVSAGYDGKVKLWKPFADEPEVLFSLDLSFDPGAIRAIAFAKGRAAAVTSSQRVYLMDSSARKVKKVFEMHTSLLSVARMFLAFSPDEKVIAVSDCYNAILCLDGSSLEPLCKLEGHQAEIVGLAFDTLGGVLLSADQGGVVIFWQPSDGTEVRRMHPGHGGGLTGIELFPSGTTIASCDTRGVVFLTSLNREDARILFYSSDFPEMIVRLSFSHNGKVLAMASKKATILWDWKTRAQLGEIIPNTEDRDSLQNHRERPVVAINPDGTVVAVNYFTAGSLGLIDIIQRARVTLLDQNHNGRVTCTSFSPTQPIFATGSSDGTVRLWDAQTGKSLVQPLHGDSARISAVSFNHNGQIVASGGLNGTVRFWEVPSGRPIEAPTELSSEQYAVLCLAFSPNRNILATGRGKDILLCDITEASASVSTLVGHDYAVWSIAFHSTKNLMASGDRDGIIILWDLVTKRRLGSGFRAHQAGVSAIVFSPDGRALISAGDDGNAVLWDVGEAWQVRAQRVANRNFTTEERRLFVEE